MRHRMSEGQSDDPSMIRPVLHPTGLAVASELAFAHHTEAGRPSIES
jgi:hypothetical protein